MTQDGLCVGQPGGDHFARFRLMQASNLNGSGVGGINQKGVRTGAGSPVLVASRTQIGALNALYFQTY